MHFSHLLVLGSEVYHRLITYSIPATPSISIRSGTTHKIQFITLAASAHTTTTRASCKNSNFMRIKTINKSLQPKEKNNDIMRKLDSLKPNLLEVTIVPCLYLLSNYYVHFIDTTIPVIIV